MKRLIRFGIVLLALNIILGLVAYCNMQSPSEVGANGSNLITVYKTLDTEIEVQGDWITILTLEIPKTSTYLVEAQARSNRDEIWVGVRLVINGVPQTEVDSMSMYTPEPKRAKNILSLSSGDVIEVQTYVQNYEGCQENSRCAELLPISTSADLCYVIAQELPPQ